MLQHLGCGTADFCHVSLPVCCNSRQVCLTVCLSFPMWTVKVLESFYLVSDPLSCDCHGKEASLKPRVSVIF
jgi:hypothetical protein